MAFPVISDTNLGGNIGQALGTGLQNLAAFKLQDIQNRQQIAQQQAQRRFQQNDTRQALKRANLPEDWALLDPSTLNQIIKYKLQGPGVGDILNSWLTGIPYGGGLLDQNMGQQQQGNTGFAQQQAPEQAGGQQQQQLPPKQQDESWPEYIARNIAKSPTLGYEMFRSGLGTGNLAELLLRKTNAPEALKSLQRVVWPTTEQANQEISKILPEYLTQHRPGDEPAEFAVGQAPFIAAGGGLKSVPALLEALATSAGLYGGSKLGSAAGSKLGKRLGDEEVGEVFGNLLGGAGGAALTHVALNRPSKTLPQQVSAAERAAFEESKISKLRGLEEESAAARNAFESEQSGSIKALESERAQAQKAFESERTKNLANLEKEYKSNIKEAQKTLNKANLEPAQQKAAFDKAKKTEANKIKNEITEYDNKIKSLEKERSPLYQEAKKFEGKKAGDASAIIKKMNEVYDNLGKGFSPAESDFLRKNLLDLERVTTDGTLSTRDAKIFKENFNNQLYNKNVSPGYKKQLVELNKELIKHIEKNSSEKHNKPYQQAEKLHKEYSELKKNRDDFVDRKNQEIKDINKEKFSGEQLAELAQSKREAQKGIKETESGYKKAIKEETGKKFVDEFSKEIKEEGKRKFIDENKEAIKAVGRETFSDFINDQKAQGNAINSLETAVNSGFLRRYSLGGLGGTLGFVFGGKLGGLAGGLLGTLAQNVGNEIRLAQEVFQKHPAIRDQYIKTIINANKSTLPQVINRLNKLGNKIEKESNASGRQ